MSDMYFQENALSIWFVHDAFSQTHTIVSSLDNLSFVDDMENFEKYSLRIEVYKEILV